MRIGVDLGGTKTEAVVLAADGREVFRERRATPRGNYDGTLAAIAALVAAGEAAAGEPCSVGVGIPGAISPFSGLVKNANSTWLNGRPLDRDLASLLGREVRVANDANCFALSEATDGAGAGHEVVFGVILGTGTGGGVVVRGRPLRGPNAVAGEWGHNPLPWAEDQDRPEPPCWCGKRGCIETYLSGPGFEREYSARAGTARGAAEIARLAASGDATARAVLDLYARRAAKALASVIDVLDPDVIVLGGGMSKLATLYDEVPRLWGSFVFSDRVDTPLEPPVHGDSSGVRGAAWLWPAEGRGLGK